MTESEQVRLPYFNVAVILTLPLPCFAVTCPFWETVALFESEVVQVTVALVGYFVTYKLVELTSVFAPLLILIDGLSNFAVTSLFLLTIVELLNSLPPHSHLTKNFPELVGVVGILEPVVLLEPLIELPIITCCVLIVLPPFLKVTVHVFRSKLAVYVAFPVTLTLLLV